MNVRAPSPLAGEGALRVSERRMRGRPTKPRRIARQHSRPATISSHKPLRVRVRTGGGGWVATYEDITERKRIEATISHDTTSLNLPNRRVFGEKVNEALARVKRGDTLTVFFVDLDNFKTINDTPGSLCWRCAPQGSRAASAGLLARNRYRGAARRRRVRRAATRSRPARDEHRRRSHHSEPLRALRNRQARGRDRRKHWHSIGARRCERRRDPQECRHGGVSG